MGLYGVMTTSVSGMAAQADRMGTVADNIANVNTTGYKRAGTEFSTLIPEARVVEYTPGSVQSHARRGVTEQGGLSYTRSPTDLAVNGNGFFMVRDSNNTPYLTRAGSFVSNSSGELVNAGGYKLLGYNLLSGDPSSIVNSAAGLAVVGTADLGLKAAASTVAKLQLNFPSSASITTSSNLPSANASAAAFDGKTSLVTYDKLGNEVILDIYAAKSAINTWEISAYDRASASVGGGFPYSSGPLSTSTLSFDASNGQFASSSATNMPVAIPGGAILSVDFSKSSQLAAGYLVQNAQVNGNPPAKVKSLEISKDGIVTAAYENGSRVAAYKIPLANVASPDNLSAISGNVFSPNSDSGDLQIGIAGTASLGSIVSGALERPTVDLATELTTMVEAQRSYTANSKVFQTGSELLDVLVNLKR